MNADTLSFDWATLGITSPALTPISPPAATCTTKDMTSLPGIEGWSLEEMFSEMSEGTSSGGEEATLVVPQMSPVVPAPPHRPDQAVYRPGSPAPTPAPPKGPKACLEEEILRIFTPEELRDADRGQWSTLKAGRSGSLSPAARKHLPVTRRKYCGRRYANKQRSGRISAANRLAIQVTALTSENQKLRLRIELLERLSTTDRYHTTTAHHRPTLVGCPCGINARTWEEKPTRVAACFLFCFLTSL